MNKIIRFFSIALATVFCLCSTAFEVKADTYTYTVSFYTGGQGTFQSYSCIQVRKGEGNSKSISVNSSSDKVSISGLEYGDVVSCDAPRGVTLNENSKYYVKGIRLSGRDNNTVDSSAFTVCEDQDYVVAYGIPGELTEYTVNYVDTEGNTLAESRTYFGNVGDKPVIAYLYINGYAPSSYNQTAKLETDKSKNVFTFVYSSLSTNGNDNNGGNAGNNGNQGNVTGGNGAGNAGAGAGNAGAGVGNAGAGNTPDGAGAGNAGAGNMPDGTDGNNGQVVMDVNPFDSVIFPELPEVNGIDDDKNVPLKDKTHETDEVSTISELLLKEGLIYPILIGMVGVSVLIVLVLNLRKLRKVGSVSVEEIVDKKEK